MTARVFKAKAKADREVYVNGITTEVECDLENNQLGSVFKAIKVLAGMNATKLYNVQYSHYGRWLSM